jgi:hypothetical protein
MQSGNCEHEWNNEYTRCLKCHQEREGFMRGRRQNPFTFKLDMAREYACRWFEVSFDKGGKCIHYLDRGEDECGLCSRNDMYRCIQDLRERPLPLSHSSIQDFLTCHHYYYITQIRGIEVIPSMMTDPVKDGALWNAALDWHISNGTTDSPAKVVQEYGMSEKSTLKIKAMIRAWKELEIAIDPDPALQKRFDVLQPVNFYWLHENDVQPIKIKIRGFFDRWYPTYFVEQKLTKSPDRYFDPFFISSQIGTYFLAEPSAEYVIIEAVRNPDLKSIRNESDEDYSYRVYEDLMTRTAHYFPGWNRERCTFGKKFMRSEFNLREIESRFEHVVREIYTCLEFKGFYKNDKACSAVLPGIPCPYLNLCRYNVASESVYRIKAKEEKL